jgi:hypothetical protein
MMKLPAHTAITLLLLTSCFVRSQETPAQNRFRPNQEVRVSGLAAQTATARDPAAVLKASLETILHDPEVCCGNKSALQGAVLSADPLSFKDLSTRLQGKYDLDDGRRSTVTADYVPASSITSSALLLPLLKNRASLVEWKSHLYVLYGAFFDEIYDSDEARIFEIHTLYLLDPRFSDARREATFDRKNVDSNELQSLLVLKLEPQ